MRILTSVRPAVNRANSWLKAVAAYLAVAGTVTFSLFILEESFQTAMFGSWPAQDAQRWDIVLEATDLMESFIDTMDTLNYAVGWVQPFAFISYRAYAQAERLYVKGLRSKVLAHAPRLMVGREVSLEFVIKRRQKLDTGLFISGGGNIGILCDEPPEGRSVALTGMLMSIEPHYFIECPGFRRYDPLLPD